MPRVSFCLLKIASVYIPLYEIEIHTSRGLLPPRARRACNKKDFFGKNSLVDPITDQRDATWVDASVWQ